MNFLRETQYLLSKEIRLEWRQRYAISGILLYVFSTVFVVYITLGQQIGGAVWGAFFWVIVLFASVNAITKSFVQENSKRQLYYYTLSNPMAVIVSKMLYNSLLLLLIATLAYGVFSILMGNPIVYADIFWLTILLGSLGFGITFTFISAISSQASQSATLMAVLSFPVVLPILMILLKLTKLALNLMTDTAYYTDMLMLLLIDVILGSLIIILFPYLWRD
ncbi:MAG: ABC transporter permease [Aureispira sp.]|nr:ABC transporter permease [Aureispira sp.]